MTTTLSVRIDSDTKDQLEALAKRARRSKSFLAAEAIAAYVEAETWQLDETHASLQELDKGRERRLARDCGLVAAVDRLAELPNLGRPGRLSGTRELVVPGTRYVTPYRVRGERLEIIAVFHGASAGQSTSKAAAFLARSATHRLMDFPSGLTMDSRR